MSLVIQNLSKTYPNGVRALNGINLTIEKGMFGLLGPNGAGKSSLMRTIATLQEPDSGSIHFGDIDVLKDKEALRRVLGYLPQEFGIYPNLPAEMVLDHFALLKGLEKNSERKEAVQNLLQHVNLWEVRKKAVGGYSGGMKQRLGIAIALIGNPQLLIVDEPTAGLDPTERHRFLNLLAEIGEKIVIILSTHIVEDVRELCSKLAIINKGNVLLTASPDDAIAEMDGKLWRKSVEKSELEAVKAAHNVISTRLVSGKPLVHVFADAEPEGFKAVEPSLEDVYFHNIAQVQAEA